MRPEHVIIGGITHRVYGAYGGGVGTTRCGKTFWQPVEWSPKHSPRDIDCMACIAAGMQ
jgi:hypothetical protein